MNILFLRFLLAKPRSNGTGKVEFKTQKSVKKCSRQSLTWKALAIEKNPSKCNFLTLNSHLNKEFKMFSALICHFSLYPSQILGYISKHCIAVDIADVLFNETSWHDSSEVIFVSSLQCQCSSWLKINFSQFMTLAFRWFLTRIARARPFIASASSAESLICSNRGENRVGSQALHGTYNWNIHFFWVICVDFTELVFA